MNLALREGEIFRFLSSFPEKRVHETVSNAVFVTELDTGRVECCRKVLMGVKLEVLQEILRMLVDSSGLYSARVMHNGLRTCLCVNGM